MKLKKNAKIALCFLGIVLVILIIVMLLKSPKGKELSEVKVVSEIKEYGYVLKENETKEYKRLFEELKDILKQDEVNEEEYVKTISQMFIIDFYTLNDKEAKTDVGGVDFVYGKAKEDFLEKAMDTIYKYVESNLYGNRSQTLPEVDKVEVKEINKVSFEHLDGKDDEAYEVTLTWTYKEELGYDKEATLTFVHEENKLSLVELK